ncbi:MAG: hypothetical protein AAGA67_07150 [Cyanobacteria bacterium P01_F01_bin.153]
MSIFHQPVILQPGQLAYLSHQSWRLYVETIDYITSRESYWVRPLVLTRHEQFLNVLEVDPAAPQPLSSCAPHQPKLLPAARSPIGKQGKSQQPSQARHLGIANSSTIPLLPPAQGPIDNHWTSKSWYDAREAAHLIWPRDAFHHALDEDILPWLPIIYGPQMSYCPPEVKNALQQFLQSLWPQRP